MKTPTFWMLFAICGLLALAMCLWPDGPVADSRQTAGRDPDSSTVEPIDRRASGRPPETKARERTPVRELAPGAGANREPVQSIPGKLVIVGRCLRPEDGTPLAGCEVFLEHAISDNLSMPGPYSPIDDSTAIHDQVMRELAVANQRQTTTARVAVRWPRAIQRDRLFLSQQALDELRKLEDCYRRKPNVVTAKDGRFRVELDIAKGTTGSRGFSGLILRGWTLSLRSPMRTPWSGEIVRKRGAVLDLGDIEMPLGTRVTGRIVDANGAPVVDALISWSKVAGDSANPDAHPLLRSGGLIVAARSDEISSQGYFALEYPIHDGSWQIKAEGDGFEIETIRFHVAGRPVDLVLRAKRLPSIRGTLRDASGAPIASKLKALGRDGRKVAEASVHADGTFEFLSNGPGESLVCLEPCGSDIHLRKPSPWLRWGETVNLVAERLPALTLRLVDAQNGTPVQGKVWLYQATSKTGRDEDCYCEATADPGVYTSDFVPSGRRWLTLRTDIYGSTDSRASGYFMTKKVLVDVPSASPREMTIRLDAAVHLNVTVVDAAGAPVLASVVDLLDARIAARGAGIDFYSQTKDDRVDGNYSMDGGAVDLLAPADTDLVLVVKGPRLAIEVRKGIRLTRGKTRHLKVVLSEGGTVQVNAKGNAGTSVELRHVESRLRVPLFPDKTGELRVPGADTRFPPPHLAPGDYEVFGIDLAGSRRKLGQVRVIKGRRTELDLDLRDHTAARVKCKVRGLPGSHRALRIEVSPVDKASAKSIEASCSPANEIDAKLPPGRYRLLISAGKSGLNQCYASAPFALAAAEQRIAPIDVAPLTVGLQITGRKFPRDAVFEFHRYVDWEHAFRLRTVLVVDDEQRTTLPYLGTQKMRIVEAITGAVSETFTWRPGQTTLTAIFR